MQPRRRSPLQRIARRPVTVRQEALDRVVVTYAGSPAAVIRPHIEVAWSAVSAEPLDEATLTAWSEQMSEGLRVIVPAEYES